MLATVRRAELEHVLARAGSCRISELAQLLDVSEMTVRRDLDELVREGKARKVFGGAVSTSGATAEEPLFAEKARRAQDEKAQIARRAAAFVEPGSAIGIGAGSTAAVFAAQLVEVPGLTVVTNSIAVSDAFHRSAARSQTVVLTGGQRTPSDALVGPASVATLAGLHVDQVFLGTHGLDLDHGLTTPNLFEADTNRALIGAAARLVVLADASKWGLVGLATFAQLADVDVLVTDAVPSGVRRAAARLVGSLVVAK